MEQNINSLLWLPFSIVTGKKNGGRIDGQFFPRPVTCVLSVCSFYTFQNNTGNNGKVMYLKIFQMYITGMIFENNFFKNHQIYIYFFLLSLFHSKIM